MEPRRHRAVLIPWAEIDRLRLRRLRRKRLTVEAAPPP